MNQIFIGDEVLGYSSELDLYVECIVGQYDWRSGLYTLEATHPMFRGKVQIICTAEELHRWNDVKDPYISLCECGAEKTGQPGHSHWCVLFRP